MVVMKNVHPDTQTKSAKANVNGSESSEGTHASGNEKQHADGKLREFDQISKDGDTLELSKQKISDAMLSGYSEARLKQLFQNKEISRQQYDKAMKNKSATGIMQQK